MAIKNLDEEMNVIREFMNTTVPTKMTATTREIASYALVKAMEISPYQTGRFIASWRVSRFEELGEPATAGQRSLSSAMSEATSASATDIASVKFGQTFYLGNNVSYAEFIEYGSPTTQAYYITRRVAQAIGGKYGRIVI